MPIERVLENPRPISRTGKVELENDRTRRRRWRCRLQGSDEEKGELRHLARRRRKLGNKRRSPGSGLTQLVSWQTHYGSLSRTAIVRRWLCHFPLYLSISSSWFPVPNKCIPRLTCNTRSAPTFPDFQEAQLRLGAWHAPLSLGLVYKTCYLRGRTRKNIFSPLFSVEHLRKNLKSFYYKFLSIYKTNFKSSNHSFVIRQVPKSTNNTLDF